jgi:hypothetical protein
MSNHHDIAEALAPWGDADLIPFAEVAARIMALWPAARGVAAPTDRGRLVTARLVEISNTRYGWKGSRLITRATAAELFAAGAVSAAFDITVGAALRAARSMGVAPAALAAPILDLVAA